MKKLNKINNEIARINYQLAFGELSGRKEKELLRRRKELRAQRSKTKGK
jgi:hypothetical protein